MGIGKSITVNVHFNRPSSLYYAGEQITGIISLYNNRKKLTLNNIFLEFIGECGYTTKDTYQSQKENCTMCHRVQFIKNRYPVVNTRDNQKEIILKRGQHSWPFEFTLPQCLPSSTVPATDSYPYVKYYTRVIIDKPWYKPHAKQIYPLTIFPNVDLCNEQGQQAVSVSRRNRKYLQLKGSLPHCGVLSGQNISLNIDLENPKRLQVKRIEASLIQHRQIAQNHHAEIIFQTELPNLRNFTGIECHRTFNLQVPYHHLSPTSNCKIQCYNSLICTDIHYELKLKVRVFGTLTEMVLNIPIIIGTEYSLDRYQLQGNDYIEMSKLYTTVMNETDLPPSYESVIEKLKLNQLIITV